MGAIIVPIAKVEGGSPLPKADDVELSSYYVAHYLGLSTLELGCAQQHGMCLAW